MTKTNSLRSTGSGVAAHSHPVDSDEPRKLSKLERRLLRIAFLAHERGGEDTPVTERDVRALFEDLGQEWAFSRDPAVVAKTLARLAERGLVTTVEGEKRLSPPIDSFALTEAGYAAAKLDSEFGPVIDGWTGSPAELVGARLLRLPSGYSMASQAQSASSDGRIFELGYEGKLVADDESATEFERHLGNLAHESAKRILEQRDKVFASIDDPDVLDAVECLLYDTIELGSIHARLTPEARRGRQFPAGKEPLELSERLKATICVRVLEERRRGNPTMDTVHKSVADEMTKNGTKISKRTVQGHYSAFARDIVEAVNELVGGGASEPDAFQQVAEILGRLTGREVAGDLVADCHRKPPRAPRG